MTSVPSKKAQRICETYSPLPFELDMSNDKRSLALQNAMASESGFHTGAVTPAYSDVSNCAMNSSNQLSYNQDCYMNPFDVNYQQNGIDESLISGLNNTYGNNSLQLQNITEDPRYTQIINEVNYPQSENSNDFEASSGSVLSDAYENNQVQVHYNENFTQIASYTHAVNRDLNYQDEATQFKQMLGDLNRLTKDPNRIEFMSLLIYLCEDEKKRNAIMKEHSIISTLVRDLASNDEATTRCAGKVLFEFSQSPVGLLSIYTCGGIPALIRLLDREPGKVLYYSVNILHYLLVQQEGAVSVIRRMGGLPKLVALLKWNNPSLLTIVTDCLRNLAFENQECKMFIYKSGVVEKLVHFMRSCHHDNLLLINTCCLLKVLSVCSTIKKTIIAFGGMQALGMHLSSSNRKLVVQCLWTMRNLSDAVIEQPNMEGILMNLVRLLKRSDKDIVECSAGILFNLTFNARYKEAVHQMKGVSALVQCICIHRKKESITEPAVGTLKHLISGHPAARMAQREIVSHTGLQVIVDLLRQATKWQLIKGVVFLIRSLLTDEINHTPLSNFSVEKRLVQLLIQAHQQAVKIEKDPEQAAKVDGVNMTDIIRVILGSLGALVHRHNTQTVLKKLNIVGFFQQLQRSEIESIRAASSNILKFICNTQNTNAGSEALCPTVSKSHDPASAQRHVAENKFQEYIMHHNQKEMNPFFKSSVNRETKVHLQTLNNEYDNFYPQMTSVNAYREPNSYPTSSRGTPISSLSSCMGQMESHESMDTFGAAESFPVFNSNYDSQPNTNQNMSVGMNHQNSNSSCSGSMEYYHHHTGGFSNSVPSPEVEFPSEDVFHSEYINPSCSSNLNSFYTDDSYFGSSSHSMPTQQNTYQHNPLSSNDFQSNTMQQNYSHQTNFQQNQPHSDCLYSQNPNTPQYSEPATPVDYLDGFDCDSQFNEDLLNNIDMEDCPDLLANVMQSLNKL